MSRGLGDVYKRQIQREKTSAFTRSRHCFWRKRNNWIEKDTGRLYITYNLKQLVEKLGRSDRTISKAMKQLSEVGLIEKKKRGQGKLDIIYVMNFTAVHKEGAKETVPEEQMEQNLPEDKMQENKREETIAETSITGKEDQRGDSRSEEITILKAKRLRFQKRKSYLQNI